MRILAVKGLSKHFGGLRAVQGVDLDVEEGQILGVIGPNGAGKTTLFNCLTGFYSPTEGCVTFNGHDISGLRPHRIAHLGVARTFQNVHLFGEMTALENVMVGFHCRTRASLFHSMLQTPRARHEDSETARRSHALLQFVGLDRQADVWGRNLAYGDQRRLEVARALATQPRLLLLDEPAAGMNPQEAVAMMELIRKIRGEGRTIILIEHHMQVVMGISDRIAVLDHGEKIVEGTAKEVSCDPQVIEAYLGKSYEHAASA